MWAEEYDEKEWVREMERGREDAAHSHTVGI
jgi:hypothetical protein